MGYGRGAGKSSGKSLGKSSDRRWSWLRTLGAGFLLLLAASGLLGLSSRRPSQKALTQASAPVPASPIPAGARSSLHSRPDARAVLGQLPLIFEANQGQAGPQVKFLARGAGYGLFLDATGAVLALQTAPISRSEHSAQFVHMKLVGANPVALPTGTDLLPGKSNYFVGNDPHRWHSDIPQFAGVRYASVYPGIDLVFYGNQGHLEYDFRIAPGADPSRAELQFDGASKLELSGGDLVVTAQDKGGVRLQAPQIYQRDGDRHTPVEGRFVLRGANRVSFEVGPYDRARELVIDPVLSFATYFGGSGTETSPSVAVNGDGFIYLAGSTTSPPSSFSLNGTAPTQLGANANVFVAKISPAQPPTVIYTTFLGSNTAGADTSVGLGVDGGGNAYLAGNTSSAGFPTTSLAYQTAPAAKGTQCTSTCTSVFVSVLNSTGSALTYSSYLSGNGNDQASGMAIDTQQDVFLTGSTTSNNAPSNTMVFPATLLPVAFQSAPLSSIQFFVTKVNTRVPGVSGIAYSTYFGGSVPASPVANGGGITVDSNGNIYFDGETNFYNSGSGLYGNSGSGDFPILNAYQPCLDTVPPVTLVNANPCTAPATTPYPTDAFVAKLNPVAQAGAQLLFSTYLGGSGSDSGKSIAIDSGALNIYLTGATNSPDFVLPTGTQAFQGCLNNPGQIVTSTASCVLTVPATNTDAYVARVSNPAVSTTGTPLDVALTYFSYLGGGGNDVGTAVAVDTASDALVTGYTNSGPANPPNFPVTSNANQSVLNGTQNAFFAHIDTTTVTNVNQVGSYATYYGGNGVDRGTSIAVDPSLNTYVAGDTTSTNLQVPDSLQGTLNGTSDAFVIKWGTAATLCITCVAPVLSPTGTVSAGNQVTITFSVSNEGPDVATGVSVTGEVPTGVTFNSATATAGTCSMPTGTTATSVVCQIPTLQVGSSSSVIFTVTAANPGTYQATAIVSNANNTNTNNTATASFIASGFSVSIAPSAVTVAAGSSAQYTVVVAPTQGVFGANVSLTCSALPTGAACNFTTSTITLSGGAGTASTILNLTTTAQPVTTVGSAAWRGPLYALWLMVPGMTFLGLGTAGKRRRSWLLGTLALTAFFCLVLLQPACHSSKTQPIVSGTPSATYPLTVTATSGSLTKTAPFSLTVIP
jgi:uncharacterized repeat protein (TIGR01451 family)